MSTEKTQILKSKFAIPLLVIACAICDSALTQTYESHPATLKFIADMSARHDYSESELAGWFAKTEKKQSILDAIARPAEKTLSWKEYRNIFVVPSRIQKGVDFWRSHADALSNVESQYGVPAKIIVSVIGVETRYGENKGRYRVMDALSTLAFDYPPRSEFFRKELEHFLLLTREQRQDPLTLLGSYAGAMGYGQFMPSSFRSYAVDYDGDKLVDIWDNPSDAIASVANYLHRHGWQGGSAIASRARIEANYDKSVFSQSLKPELSVHTLHDKGIRSIEALDSNAKAKAMRLEGANGAEFWLGLQNFYVITRYNHSALYAMAVFQLGEAIEQAKEQYSANLIQRR